VALILAVNPGNSHSPTLSRLARELPGCELIGAESCAVAIRAIKKRVPDVLLLPAAPARGEADLMAHLRSVPGGVLTLKLPPVKSANPVDLARQIREMLTGVPASTPSGFDATRAATPSNVDAVRASTPSNVDAARATDDAPARMSPHLIAAATAAITWARVRRAQWPELREPDEPSEPAEASEPGEPSESGEPELYEPIGPYEPIELSDEPYEPHAGAAEGAGGSIAAFLPRAAALAVVIVVAATAIWYWPQIRGVFGNRVEPLDTPKEASQPAAVNPEPAPPQQPAPPEPAPKPDPAETASGWVTVVSPLEVSISEGDQPVPLDDQGRAVLAPGRHRLRFQNPERGYDATRTVQVKPNETMTMTLTPEATIGVTSNEPAEVLIDGTRVGDTPYEGKVGLGTHTVTVRTAGAERQLTVEATSKPVQLEVDFSKP